MSKASSSLLSGATGGNSSTKSTQSLPWVEKYRPKTVDEISHQDEVVRTLKSSITSGSLPHLLFYGPAGTGKTSTILAVARELFGPEFRDNGRTLELNASDERGISVVRDKVKSFAQRSVAKKSNMPPFKLIILDEADSMTGDAQAALRRMMEQYSTITRFCLICNYVSRIIEPVASRCAKFRFQPLERGTMLKRLKFIQDSESTDCSDEVLQTILEICKGDMRKAINILQSTKQIGGEAISPKIVVDIAGVVPKNYLEKFWAIVKQNQFAKLQAEVEDMVASGYSVLSILEQLSIDLLEQDFSDDKKAKIAIRIAQADKKLDDGASEYLQLLDVAAFTMRTAN